MEKKKKVPPIDSFIQTLGLHVVVKLGKLRNLGQRGLLEEMGHWGQALRLYSLSPLPVCFLSFLVTKVIGHLTSQVTCCPHHHGLLLWKQKPK